MKKGAAVGIGLSIIVVSIIFGIASLPDEVLIESPSLETSETLPLNEGQINIPITEQVAKEPVIEEPTTEQVAKEPVIEEPTTEQVTEEPVTEEPTTEQVAEETDATPSESNTIRVEIRDGIGSVDR